MAGRIDSASAGAEIVNAYDSQIDSLMDAIASYVGRDTYQTNLGFEVPVGDDVTINSETGSPVGLRFWRPGDPPIDRSHDLTLTRGENDLWTDAAGNSYVFDSDSGRFTATEVNVGGRMLDAASVEDPGFGLLSAAAVNDGTSNIGLATKLIMDQAGWAKQISRATQG